MANLGFGAAIYAVTTSKSRPNSAKVVEWVRSPQGQRLALANKYAPLADTGE